MKQLFVIVAIICLHYSQSIAQIIDSISIEISMPSKSITRLRYYDDHNKTIPLTFKNSQPTSQVVLHKAFVNKPTIFDYKIVTGEDQKIEHYILGYPNSTLRLVLDSAHDIHFQDKDTDFIEQLIHINYNTLSINEAYSLFEKNQIVIDSLIAIEKINTEDKLPLQLFLELKYLSHIADLQVYKTMI